MQKLFAIILWGAIFTQATVRAEEVFTISSPNFKNGDTLSKSNEFNGFGCDKIVLNPYNSCSSGGSKFNEMDCNGGNIAPTIQWINPPAATKSFAFTIADVSASGGLWNFIIYNIPRSERAIASGQIPQGAITVNNDSGTKYYMGPCPPRGDKPHRYAFTIYALDTNLDLPMSTTPGLAIYMINRHKIATASIMATYARP